ncbi:hypothetical protein G6F56_013401 [Rhizopus delemar]|nr:hypothetical protein G6F56_013401 [Rhizopus delemar]
MKCKLVFFLVVFTLIQSCVAGPLSYAICQTGCNAVVVACYAGAGFVFGTITGGLGAPPAILACNAGLGVCMSGCVAAGFAPIP